MLTSRRLESSLPGEVEQAGQGKGGQVGILDSDFAFVVCGS